MVFLRGGNLALQIATKWHQFWLYELLNTSPEMIKVNFIITSYPVVETDSITSLPDRGLEIIGKKAQTVNERIFGVKYPQEKEINEFDILRHIDKRTPPMFIWSTFEDELVSITNTLALANRLTQENIPFELHIFEEGVHGLALADRTTSNTENQFNSQAKKWFDLFEGWISKYIE